LANQEERASSSENTRKVVSGSALHLLNLKVLIFFSLLQTVVGKGAKNKLTLSPTAFIYQ
jgi:hypothetical protein